MIFNKKEFPAFKDITLSSKDEINKVTENFLPYSVFSFSDLLRWSDDTIPTQYCIYDNNLLIKIKDFIQTIAHTNTFYAFMGTTNVKENIEILVKKLTRLDLVPQEIVASIENEKKYKITLNESNTNYVLSIDNILNPKKKTNKKIIKFYKDIKRLQKRLLDFSNPADVAAVLELFKQWQSQKNAVDDEIKREFEALKKTIKYSKNFKYYNLGIYDNRQLVGFTINEVIRDTWVDGCFGKTDLKYPSLSTYMEYETAKILKSKGFEYLNIEQDLGIEGIRKHKQSLQPIMYLNMYSIELRK